MQITAQDIRFARPCDLAEATGLDASAFTAWTRNRSITDRSITLIAEKLEITPGEFLEGWRLRRQDAVVAKEALTKFRNLITKQTASP